MKNFTSETMFLCLLSTYMALTSLAAAAATVSLLVVRVTVITLQAKSCEWSLLSLHKSTSP